MSKFDSKDFGERIKNFRMQKGLSQENLASKLNKDRTAISRYERGELLPNAEDISLICEELGIYEADLFTNNNVVKTMQKEKSKNPFGTDKLMLGGYFGTNAKCEPSLRKCYFSKKNIDFTDKMFEKLKLDENEQEILDKQNALYLDIFNI